MIKAAIGGKEGPITQFFALLLTIALSRIIHQPEKSTGKGTFGAKMSLTTTVSQDHHDPKTSATSRPGTPQIGLMVASRHKSSWQPLRAYNHRFALEPSWLSIALPEPARSDARTLTRSNCASKPAPLDTT